MKKLLFIAGFLIFSAFGNQQGNRDEYVLIAWNDLGMHCANKDFQNMAILPPYNNLMAQVILRGNAAALPELITGNMTVSYEIPGNTFSVGKTNFWDFDEALFGINLPDDIGLTGNGLSGFMVSSGDHFIADGIPVTPYTDDNLVNEDPYQLALLRLFDDQQVERATTQPVVPVSNEINCVSAGCHPSETHILNEHEEEGGFDPTNTPILCASCHPDNALGEPGVPGVPSLSYVIHEKHAEETNDCYKCHPGPNTQCHRDVMKAAGLTCQDCHGNVEQVASSIENGREPWLEEPRCGDDACHGPDFAEEPGKLFRQSKGHGGLYCSACHGSPHVILPSLVDRDNIQNIALQGFAGTLASCWVCHGEDPQAPGPHGLYATYIEEIAGQPANGMDLIRIYPLPATERIYSEFSIASACRVQFSILDPTGILVMQFPAIQCQEGTYCMEVPVASLDPGYYLLVMQAGNNRYSQKIVVLS